MAASTHPPVMAHTSDGTSSEMLPTRSVSQATIHIAAPLDIEHMPVHNDPRLWSATRKNVSLALIASASMIAGLAASIQNPAVEEMQNDLDATSAQFSLSISLFILVQGLVPLVWSAISEIKGRKLVYIMSLALFTIGSIVVAVSNSMDLVIGFRSLQAAGSAAVITIGAATLADIFEPAERGTKMGIYYMAPLLGPSLGPILGGILTTGLNWRAIFWCCTIMSGSICLIFLFFFDDTFRRERSLTYQNVLRKRLRDGTLTPNAEKNAQGSFDTPPSLSLKDVNPIKPLWLVLRRWNNVTILSASGLLFGFAFTIAYTCARTLSLHYHYNALKIGLVLLAFGLGSLAGSLLGGRWSDRELARLKALNGGNSYPEMRLKSAIYSIFIFPPCVLGFGWLCEKRVHISAICVMLFACGLFSIWTYSSAIAYIVDSNTGRSSTAVATNSAFRGIYAFVATEVAVPLQDGLGDGWMYTIWAGLMLISGLLVFLVAWRGELWRKRAELREALHDQKTDAAQP
ncbi:major facilitator superfamily domain-containing protein [Collybia nuda]|uniref:Major facilitator superfamily domain-containing protein n=1 Tax=Collybia nuda TaxID=64659 RepID=A0A9P5YGX1_9AGAR|nr:major facilitator superfamily domain-containing protein [Collybia nuda]